MVTSFDWQSILLQWKRKFVSREQGEKRYKLQRWACCLHLPEDTHPLTQLLHEQGQVATIVGKRNEMVSVVHQALSTLFAPVCHATWLTQSVPTHACHRNKKSHQRWDKQEILGLDTRRDSPEQRFHAQGLGESPSCLGTWRAGRRRKGGTQTTVWPRDTEAHASRAPP
jgi:hypothetical protein